MPRLAGKSLDKTSVMHSQYTGTGLLLNDFTSAGKDAYDKHIQKQNKQDLLAKATSNQNYQIKKQFENFNQLQQLNNEKKMAA